MHNSDLQRTDTWFEQRLGKVTASNFSKVLAKGAGKTRLSYMKQLAGEIITGEPAPSFTNKAIQEGIRREPESIHTYEFLSGNAVDEVGFITLPANGRVGCSPDGIIGSNGLIEVKNPNVETHIDYLLADKIPNNYYCQVQGQIWVTGREWCDFVSYYPGMRMLVKRFKPNEKFIEELASEVEIFLFELDILVAKLKEEPLPDIKPQPKKKTVVMMDCPKDLPEITRVVKSECENKPCRDECPAFI